MGNLKDLSDEELKILLRDVIEMENLKFYKKIIAEIQKRMRDE